MKATFKHTSHSGNIAKHRKENNGFSNEYAVLVQDKLYGMRAAVTLRIYYTPSRMYGSTAYACIWINGRNINLSGGGKAGGCGYHKASAAVSNALDDAGVTLNQSIHGVGDTAIRDALEAIAKALGYRKFHIHHAHA